MTILLSGVRRTEKLDIKKIDIKLGQSEKATKIFGDCDAENSKKNQHVQHLSCDDTRRQPAAYF